MVLVPAGIAVVGAIPVLVMVRRVAREARALQHTISRLGELREPVADLRMRVSVLALPRRLQTWEASAPPKSSSSSWSR